MEIFFALVLLLVVVGLATWYFYNKIIKLKVRVSEGWSDINVQLKRRHNLIGNLVETVKGYATHEKDTLEKVVQARQAAADAEGKDAATLAGVERQLSTAMQGLNINALAEAYPDLKANTNFLQLQAELADTENKIAASRRFYNTTVTSLNTTIQQFPGNLVKGLAKAEKAEFFEIEEDQAVKEVPQVDFHKDTVAAQGAEASAAADASAAMPAMTTPTAPATAADQTTSSSEAPTEAAPAPAPTPKLKEEPKPAPAAPASGEPEPAKEEPKPAPAPTPEPAKTEPAKEEPTPTPTPEPVKEEASAPEAAKKEAPAETPKPEEPKPEEPKA